MKWNHFPSNERETEMYMSLRVYTMDQRKESKDENDKDYAHKIIINGNHKFDNPSYQILIILIKYIVECYYFNN